MPRKRKYIVISAGIIVIALMTCSLFIGSKFLNHEFNQSDRISALEGRISLLEEKEKLSGNPADGIWAGGVQLFSYR